VWNGIFYRVKEKFIAFITIFKSKSEKDADTRALEKQMSEAMGLGVEIKHRDKAGGQVVINYKTLDQLDDVIRKLGGSV